MSQKGIHSYEHMNYWEEFNEKSLPEIKDCYSYLNMENITDACYPHAKRVFKHFETKNSMVFTINVMNYC